MPAAAFESSAESRGGPHRPLTTGALSVIYAIVLSLAFAAEIWRWLRAEASPLTGWLCGEHADWLPFLTWLLIAPLFWRARGRKVASGSPLNGELPISATTGREQRSPRGELWRAWGFALLASAAAFAMSWHVADRFGELPPAYHDEYSYLIQAKTFLAGRLWFPSFEPMPELFDQMHVLNEGRFASRYFPGVGLWMAPFVALDHPWLGHWVANAFAACFLFWAGREIGGNLVGFLAGLLFALSPGIALFSNLLLAHHPTLVGLMLFLWAFLRMRRTGSLWCAFAAGVGLTFAMLCRPMTAFGFGLPFGAVFAWWLVTGRAASPPRAPQAGRLNGGVLVRVKTAAAIGAPVVAGLIALYGYNHAITGDGWTTPYQLYTDIYTPRHRYGFDNVVIGEQRLGPKVLENYDRWAENLDAELAARNVARRLVASLRWTLGILPLIAGGLVLMCSRSANSGGVRLVAAAILSLHAVHVPYWFEGIMGWHYVFESAPLWLLLFAEASRRLWAVWSRDGRGWMRAWWIGLVGLAVTVNLVTVEPLWPGRLNAGIAEVSFSRQRYAAFHERVGQIVGDRKAVIFIEPDPADRHIDYVVNDPTLDGQVVRARYRPERTDLEAARALFPEREAYLYRAATGEWSRLP